MAGRLCNATMRACKPYSFVAPNGDPYTIYTMTYRRLFSVRIEKLQLNLQARVSALMSLEGGELVLMADLKNTLATDL